MNTKYIRPPIDRLVTNGKYNIGRYNTPVKQLNLIDAENPLGFPVPRFIKQMRLREWQAFQLGNPDYFIFIAIYNTKTLGIVQCIVYDKKKKNKIRYEKQLPSWKVHVAAHLDNTRSYYHDTHFKINVHNHIQENRIDIDVLIDDFKDLPSISAHFSADHSTESCMPNVVCLPFNRHAAMYSHKALMPMEGEVKLDGEKLSFSKKDSWLIMDDHKGFYPRITYYDWATAAGYINDNLIGFNFTDNQVENQELYNENCLWVNNKLHILPPIKVTRPRGIEKTWYIKDQEGRVDVSFRPLVNTTVLNNFIFIESKYYGPYGDFEGYIYDNQNKKIDITGLFGAGEKFYLKI